MTTKSFTPACYSEIESWQHTTEDKAMITQNGIQARDRAPTESHAYLVKDWFMFRARRGMRF